MSNVYYDKPQITFIFNTDTKIRNRRGLSEDKPTKNS